MKKYALIFTMGPNTNQHERVYVNAENSDQAYKMAYQMRQAQQYKELILSEFKEGECGYIVAFNYCRYYYGKRDNHKFEERFVFKATSLEQAKRYFYKKYYGKYQNKTYDAKQDKELESCLNTDCYCSIEIGSVFDVYQFATNPDFYEKFEDATQA